MITIPMNAKGAVNRDTILSINTTKSGKIQNVRTISASSNGSMPSSAATKAAQNPAQQSQSVQQQASARQQSRIQRQTPGQQAPVQQSPVPQPVPVSKPIPPLRKPVQKGQKVSLETASALSLVRACFGWNTDYPQCDVDVSAFLLGADGKVPGDSWFVFYGQTASPDGSTRFQITNDADREAITIDLRRLHPQVQKIVFVLTINEAFEKKLHFGMMKDAYIRVLNAADQSELVSFKMTDYYSNVISMMIGELYQHNGIWKFNAVGNGVARDLSGLCALYGVQVQN